VDKSLAERIRETSWNLMFQRIRGISPLPRNQQLPAEKSSAGL